MLSKYQADLQQMLDELFHEYVIPFELTACQVTQESDTELKIHFHDSRLHSIVLEIGEGPAFKEQLRVAVLLRLLQLGGPLSDEIGIELSAARK